MIIVKFTGNRNFLEYTANMIRSTCLHLMPVISLGDINVQPVQQFNGNDDGDDKDGDYYSLETLNCITTQ